jgi:hypothetical protein
MVAPVQLTAEQVAERVPSITAETWRRYVYGQRAPQPDAYVGRTPVWNASTVDRWKRDRPGRGAGGGRPRKTPAEASTPATEAVAS